MAIVRDMRERKAAPRQRRSFMPPHEFVRLRKSILHVTQKVLAEEMISPQTGEPVSNFTLCRWERGMSPVPLWAARRLRALAQVAASQDAVQSENE